MNDILEYLLLGAGIYYIVMVIRMKLTGSVPNALISKKINLERSKDIPGFIRFMYPRGLIFGGLVSGFSLVIILSHYIAIHPVVCCVAEFGFVAVLVWYAIVNVKAQNRFLF